MGETAQRGDFGSPTARSLRASAATLELQVLAVRLAQRVDWTLDRPVANGAGLAPFATKGGVPITVH